MHLMERETQTTDSLNEGLPKSSTGNENQNSSKKSITLTNYSRNETIDYTTEEFLEQFDADVVAYWPSVTTISSASENMSPDSTSNNSQDPPECTSQNSYNTNTTISDANLKIKNVPFMPNNQLAIFSSKEKRDVRNSSHLNVSHNTNKENKEKPTNISEVTKTKRQPLRKTIDRNYNYSELDNSSVAVKKYRQRKTISKSSKGKSCFSRNSTVCKEDKKTRDSKRVSTAIARKSKASTSKVSGTRSMRLSAAQQPSKIETSTTRKFTNTNKSNLEVTAADNKTIFTKLLVRSSAKRRRRTTNNDASVIRKELTSITSSEYITDNENNQTKTVTARSSLGPSCIYWNDNVPVNSILPEQSEETSKSPNLPMCSIKHEQSQKPPVETITNLEKTVVEVPTQVETSVPKPVKESCKKSVMFNEAQTPMNLLAKMLFPPHNNETEYSPHLPIFDDDVQHDEGKEPQNRQNTNAEELDQNTNAEELDQKTNAKELDQNTNAEEMDQNTNAEELDQNTLYTVINNKAIGIEWIYKMPPSQTSKSSEGVIVTYHLKNLKTQQGTMSNGLIRFDPGQQRVQVTKKYCIVYKVDKGEATVNIQLQKRNVGVGCCFHIPLGSTYSITNQSEVEPLILFFTKVSAP